MTGIDFNHKKFALVANSESGKVNADTIFEYKQEGKLVTADYHGGTIRYGKIIAYLSGNKLDMLYQCITTDDELKAGKAVADISIADNNKMRLRLNWEWLGDRREAGVSEYLEM